MIIGPDFVWLHFPKCGGTAVQSALQRIYQQRRDVVFDPIDPRNVIWHHSIRERERYDSRFDSSGKRILCGFRQLPHWIVSRVHFEAQRPPGRIATRAMLVRGQFYEQSGAVNPADTYVRKYSDPKVDTWIRTEHIVDDLSRALDIDPQLLSRELQHRNVNKTVHIRELAFWFTPEELAALYAANPEWAAIEKALYGELLTL